MKDQHFIPYIGEVFTETTTTMWFEEITTYIKTDKPAFFKRFAVTVGDDGLAGLGIHPGDYLIFRKQDWPNNEEQIVFVQFGDDCIARILEGIWDAEPLLKLPGQRYETLKIHRNQYTIGGVLEQVIKPEFAEVISGYDIYV